MKVKPGPPKNSSMNYSVLATPPFDKQLKGLAKKYPSLKKEYAELIGSLGQQPDQRQGSDFCWDPAYYI